MVTLFVLSIILNANARCSAANAVPRDESGRTDEPKTAQHLERLDESKLKILINSRNGKALFVNVWATWCDPCVEEFPDIVRLSEEMKGREIDFVGVSGDYFEDEMSKVIPFIAKERAHFKFYIAKIEGEDAFINSFDKRWGGGIPATFTYDANGRLKRFLIGKQSYQELKDAVEKALGY